MKKILGALVSALLLLIPIAGAADITVTTSVAPYITVTFLYNTVDFGTLTAGTNDNLPTPSHTTGAYNVSIDTNKDYKLEASGTDFTGAVSSFSISNLNLGMNETATALTVTDSISLSTTPTVVESNVPYTQTINFHGYWLDIPTGQYAEAYSSTVTITYSSM